MSTVPLTEKVRRIAASNPPIANLRPVIEKQLFQQEMSRFLDKTTLSETAAHCNKSTDSLIITV